MFLPKSNSKFNIQNPAFKIALSPLLGTYPSLTPEMLDYEIQVIREFLKTNPF